MSEMSVQTEIAPTGSGSVVVRISGDMTIPNASELRERLLEAFRQADCVTLDLNGVTGIDVSGLQLLCSAHRSSVVLNKAFTIVGREQPAVRDVASAAGQLRSSGCAQDVCHTCIWTGGRY